MTLTTLRLSYRLGRFELLAFGIAIVAVAIGCVVAAAYISSLAPPAVCFEPFVNELPLVCQNAGSAFYEAFSTYGDPLRAAIVSLPLAAGAFLGVPVVARELERGTSRLAWSLAPSRWRWYLSRVLPTVVVVTVLGLVAGFGADLLLGAAEPNLDVNAAFSLFGYRGIPLAARAVFVLGLAVACGAILGRSLPALIVTAVIAAFALTGGAQVHDRILAGEAVPVLQSDFRPGDRWIDTRFLLPDGTLVGYDSFVDGNPYDDMGMPLYPELVLAVPGERYPAAVVREALALAGGSLIALLIGGFVVARRRPG
jgi:hypothetical protein